MIDVLDVRVVTGSGGGPEKTIMNSPRHLESHGYRMHCAYMHPPRDAGFGVLKQKAAGYGTALISVPDHGPLDWRVVTQLLTICRELKIKIWHGHDYKSNALGLILRRLWPMRLVTTVHGWVQRTRRTPLYYWIDRLALRQYEEVICVSPDLFSACRKNGVPSKRCHLLENGIDLQDFQRRQTTDAAKRALGIPPDRQVLGAVGRLSPEKGFDLLIQSAHQLIQKGNNLHLLIFGEGSQFKHIQSQINALGQTHRIQLMGYRADLRPCYEAMDIFVLSSLREGLPNVVLEAMALEVPVIATRVAGIPRLIQHEKNGIIIDPNSAGAITDALASLIQDEDRKTRFREHGRKTIENQYCFARRMTKLRELYDKLLRS